MPVPSTTNGGSQSIADSFVGDAEGAIARGVELGGDAAFGAPCDKGTAATAATAATRGEERCKYTLSLKRFSSWGGGPDDAGATVPSGRTAGGTADPASSD